MDEIRNREAQRSLARLLPRVEQTCHTQIAIDLPSWETFKSRLEQHFPALFDLYFEIYHDQYDFFYHLEDLLLRIAQSWLDRSVELKELDALREENPRWFQSHKMVGAVCYVDLFANDLEGMVARIPYLKELGLTYLHLMPLFKMPQGENDGGYAVSDYREVHSPLGTMQQLAYLAEKLHEAGISLVLDLVFNHTSDEHPWAKAAKTGDETFQHFYRLFKTRDLPDQYEKSLREIFPEEHTGAFTYNPDLFESGGWVWTTFHSYQWDLNYSNPAVFNHMADEMLFLANQGVDVLRLDAVAFIWKQLGTNCENLPQAHGLIRAFNAVARIAAPGMLFKSEAIVHPDEVVKYISPLECQISYNPLLMALLWNSAATRKVRLLAQALATRFALHPDTSWVNYIRVHDDIGWTFSDEDAALLGINGYDHRQFLNEFYRGRFPGSFARGLPFQENPQTGDCRISGTCASLAGLEKALKEEGPEEVDLAIRRILLLYGVVFTAGGIPLIYLGDEIGTLNDYSFREDALHAEDSRWVHRVQTDWERVACRHMPDSIENRVYTGMQALIGLRKSWPVFSDGNLQVFWTGNEHVLGYHRFFEGQHCTVLANFSDTSQMIAREIVREQNLSASQQIFGAAIHEIAQGYLLEPLDFLVLSGESK